MDELNIIFPHISHIFCILIWRNFDSFLWNTSLCCLSIFLSTASPHSWQLILVSSSLEGWKVSMCLLREPWCSSLWQTLHFGLILWTLFLWHWSWYLNIDNPQMSHLHLIDSGWLLYLWNRRDAWVYHFRHRGHYFLFGRMPNDWLETWGKLAEAFKFWNFFCSLNCYHSSIICLNSSSFFCMNSRC